jgi:hypothetical protein
VRRADEHQVGDAGAGDQRDERDRAEQYQSAGLTDRTSIRAAA